MDQHPEFFRITPDGPYSQAAEAKRVGGVLARLAQRGAAVSNERFYEQCLRDLAEFYGVRYAFIGVFSDHARTAIKTIAGWADGALTEQIEYCLMGTPCQTVLDSRQLYVPDNLTSLYPHDELLIPLGAVSYFGVPLGEPHSGAPGLIFLIDDKPMHLSEDEQMVLRVFATRITAELLWQQQPEVTNKAQLERELANVNQDLNIAYNELNGLYDVVNHDLRVPLRSITGFSEAILTDDDNKLDDQTLDYVRRINKASIYMESQISTLAHLRRVSICQMMRTPVDLSRLVHEVAASIRASGIYDHDVQITVESGIKVNADRYMLKELLCGLLDNAWKFTVKTPDPRVKVHVDHGSEADVFVIEDNGVGFDMRYANKLFTLFHRLHHDTDYAGHGVGLAMVHRVVRRHGGQVWADSSVGNGARFYFTLPEEIGTTPV